MNEAPQLPFQLRETTDIVTVNGLQFSRARGPLFHVLEYPEITGPPCEVVEVNPLSFLRYTPELRRTS